MNKVVLYKNGISYIERKELVQEGEEITVRFTRDQMQDVLASFYAVDLDGGQIDHIGYDSETPRNRLLAENPLEFSRENTMESFLQKLQGVPVQIQLSENTVQGDLMGTQSCVKKSEEGVQFQQIEVTVMTEDGTIRSFPLQDVKGVTVQDDRIQSHIEDYLAVKRNNTQRGEKTVRIQPGSSGTRTIQYGYFIESPAWKSSYRLIFGENEQPVLQGWASIENQTSEDWEEISVELISGNPVSFRMDLYSPFYPERMEVPISTLFPGQNLQPLTRSDKQTRERGKASQEPMTEDKSAEVERQATAPEAPERPGEGTDSTSERTQEAQVSGERAIQEVQTSAVQTEVGTAFSYSIEHPVSVERGESALVPIFQEHVGGEHVLYFNEEVSTDPMKAFHLKNSSELTIDTGPVTIYQDGTCLGEALIPRVLTPDMTELLPYASAPGVTISSDSHTELRDLQKLEIQNRIFREEVEQVKITEYLLKNETSEARRLILDHPKEEGFHLNKPEPPEEILDRRYRFAREIPPNDEETLCVEEQRTITKTIKAREVSAKQIKYWFEHSPSSLPDAEREQLDELYQVLNALQKRNAKLQETEEQIEGLRERQSEFRKNMQSLSRQQGEASVRERYISRIEKAEEQIDELLMTKEDLEEKISKDQERFDSLLDSISQQS